MKKEKQVPAALLPLASLCRRRTRAMMGYCQGEFCGHRVFDLKGIREARLGQDRCGDGGRYEGDKEGVGGIHRRNVGEGLRPLSFISSLS